MANEPSFRVDYVEHNLTVTAETKYFFHLIEELGFERMYNLRPEEILALGYGRGGGDFTSPNLPHPFEMEGVHLVVRKRLEAIPTPEAKNASIADKASGLKQVFEIGARASLNDIFRSTEKIHVPPWYTAIDPEMRDLSFQMDGKDNRTMVISKKLSGAVWVYAAWQPKLKKINDSTLSYDDIIKDPNYVDLKKMYDAFFTPQRTRAEKRALTR